MNMNDKLNQFINQLREKSGLTPQQEELIQKELQSPQEHNIPKNSPSLSTEAYNDIYTTTDFKTLLGMYPNYHSYAVLLQTIDQLIDRDKQREKDGFPRRIRLGKLVKPSPNNKGQVVIVPTTTETKFYHGDSETEEEGSTGGTGEGEVGEVLGEQPINPEKGEGEAQGAGRGKGGSHDIGADAFDLGRILTEQFQLPNLKDKGKKKSLTKFQYDLTDINNGFGQILDKKATIKKVVQTNIQLGRIKGEEETINTDDLLISPKDKVYRILSKEQDYDSQAVVFFLRDYSGSMQGKPTEVITTQHLFIYSWLMYQYKNNVMSRFILHDTEAKEVEDFYTYYKSTVAGGTNVYPAFELVDKIVQEEQLAKDYNIYVFHGTDGDDWDNTGEQMLKSARKILSYTNRLGITVAKNNWGAHNAYTTVEKYLMDSGILQENADLIKIDSMIADNVNETRIIEGIRKLVE
jgi:uncharacterized protein